MLIGLKSELRSDIDTDGSDVVLERIVETELSELLIVMFEIEAPGETESEELDETELEIVLDRFNVSVQLIAFLELLHSELIESEKLDEVEERSLLVGIERARTELSVLFEIEMLGVAESDEVVVVFEWDRILFSILVRIFPAASRFRFPVKENNQAAPTLIPTIYFAACNKSTQQSFSTLSPSFFPSQKTCTNWKVSPGNGFSPPHTRSKIQDIRRMACFL